MNCIRRRKCLNCGELYKPDTYNANRQKYCSKPACQHASHQASQRRWLAHPENKNYHGEGSHVDRVLAWRKAHPGYWRRKAVALQDVAILQHVPVKPVTPILRPADPEGGGGCSQPGLNAQPVVAENVASYLDRMTAGAADSGNPGQAAPLQDSALTQHLLIVGLISMLTDALQDDIGGVMAKLQNRGRAILGKGFGIVTKGA